MKRIAIINLLLVLALASCTKSIVERVSGDFVLKGNVQLEDGVDDLGIEVFAFPSDIRYPKEADMLAKTQADKDGNFTLRIPDSLQFLNLHFTSPNYITYQTVFSVMDENPEIDVVLKPNAVSSKFNNLKIYGDFNGFNWDGMVDMNKVDENTFDITIEFDKPEMKYQIKFDTEEHTYPNIVEGAEYEYDFGGDHRTIAKSDNGKYHITVDMNNYKVYTNKKEVQSSEGAYKNSPVNEIYPIISNKLGSGEVASIWQYFYIVVERKQPDQLEGWSEEDIQRTSDRTIKRYHSALDLADSLLEITKNQYIKDYILAAKIRLLNITDTVSYEDLWAIFNKINIIPEDHNSCYTSFIYDDEFEKNQEIVMPAIEMKISKEKNDTKRAELLYNYYRAFEGKIKDNKILRNIVINGLEKLSKMDIKEDWLKKAAPKMLARIKLKDSKLAPDFEFTLLDGKTSQLSRFNGTWVLLHFWSINCHWCVSETKYLVEAYNKLKDKNFNIISIADCPDITGTVEYIKANDMKWYNTITLENYAKAAEDFYGVEGVPTLFLINPQGELVQSDDVNLRGKDLIKTLEKYIGI